MLHRLELVALSELERRGWPDNAKRHDLPGVQASIRRFGYQDPVMIEPASGKVAKGHGRLEALRLLRDAGRPEDWGNRPWPPRGVLLREDGDWLVPVVFGPPLPDAGEARAYVVADNRQVELGGWDPELLARWLQEIQEAGGEEALAGVGYGEDDLAALLRTLEGVPDGGLTPEDKLPQYAGAEVKQVVLYFAGPEYESVIDRMRLLMARAGVANHSELFLRMLEHYAATGPGEAPAAGAAVA